MNESFIASIFLFGGNFPIRGWAFCDGSILSIAQNTAVFSLVGTTYGGNGQTTFALPDLRGRVPIHTGNGAGPGLSPYALGQKAGNEAITVTQTQMPMHIHPATGGMQVLVANAAPSTEEAVGATLTNTANNFYATAPTAGQALGGPSLSVQLGVQGASQPLPILQPYTAMNYLFCMQGIFPSRN